MSQFSDFLETKVIDHLIRGQAYTVATQVFAALYTGFTGLETNTQGAVTYEVPAGTGAYVRTVVAFNAAVSGAGTTENTAEVAFATATASWGVISHMAIVDSATGTQYGTNVNILMWGTLTATKDVGTNDQFKFAAGDIDITIQ